MSLKPFADEEATIEIGGLTVENRLDRVSLFGSLDLTYDKEGLGQAKELLALLTDVVEILSKLEARGDLPDKVKLVKVGTVKNPFS